MINRIIQFLGRKDYVIDKEINIRDISIIICERMIQLVRGIFLKLIIGDSTGLIFKGKNVKIKHAHKISTGKTLIVEDNVYINALSKNGIILGNNVTIQRGTIIECTGVIREIGIGLKVGNNVGMAPNCFIQVRGRVEIGSNVIFGPGVCVFSENHLTNELKKYINEQGTSRKGVVIENGVWIGSGAKVLDGVKIGENSVIAAGSIVTKSVPPFTVYGGVPAKLIKTRNDEEN